MSEFGKRIHILRVYRGMSREELAKLIYSSAETIRRWEYGTRFPKIDALPELSELLGVPLEWLYGEGPALGYERSVGAVDAIQAAEKNILEEINEDMKSVLVAIEELKVDKNE